MESHLSHTYVLLPAGLRIAYYTLAQRCLQQHASIFILGNAPSHTAQLRVLRPITLVGKGMVFKWELSGILSQIPYMFQSTESVSFSCEKLCNHLPGCCSKCDSLPRNADSGNCVQGICMIHPGSDVAARAQAAQTRNHINSCTSACVMQIKLARSLFEDHCTISKLIVHCLHLDRTNPAIPLLDR
jgi:hypothetical protein